MSRTLVTVGFVLLFVCVQSGCFPFYRYQSAACKQRGAAYGARLEKLRQEAPAKLSLGTRKDAVIRFFEANGIPVTFQRGEATGMLNTVGCAPAGCGSDNAFIGLKVPVDGTGTVIGKPVVGGFYTDCL